MTAKPHILSVRNPLLPNEWKTVRAACGEEIKEARPVTTIVTESGLGVLEVFNALQVCVKCVKQQRKVGWKKYSYGIVSGQEQVEELRREMEA